jgi:hypothetical protein
MERPVGFRSVRPPDKHLRQVKLTVIDDSINPNLGAPEAKNELLCLGQVLSDPADASDVSQNGKTDF